MDLTTLADAMERFSEVGVIGYSIAIFGLIVTGWLYTRGQVETIKKSYEERIARMEKILDQKYAAEERREQDQRDERRSHR